MLFIKLVWLQRTASSLLCTHGRFVFLPDNGDRSNSERAEPKNRYSFERGRVPLCRTAGKDFAINPGSSASCCWNFQGVDMILFWKKQTVQSLLQKKIYPALVGFCCVDDALQTFGSSYWPRDMRVSLEAFRKHLHTFSRVWVLTVSHIDSARKTRRNHGIIELWNAVQSPQAERFPVCNNVAPWLVSLLPVEGSAASTRRTRLLAPPPDHQVLVLFFCNLPNTCKAQQSIGSSKKLHYVFLQQVAANWGLNILFSRHPSCFSWTTNHAWLLN